MCRTVGVAAKEIKQIRFKVDEIQKSIAHLRSVIADGEEKTFPWHALAYQKMKQVEAVLEYLREHRTATVSVAVQKTFRKVSGGYEKWTGLKSYCYRIDIGLYV